jgi:hypothetical protein
MYKKTLYLLCTCCILQTAIHAQTDWHITGNSGTNPPTNFLGTSDNKALVFKTTNSERMRISSTGQVAIGTSTPAQRLDVHGNINISNGFGLYMENHPILRIDSLHGNTLLGNGTAPHAVGTSNSAVGYQALFSNITGSFNTALGSQALFTNNSGFYNVAVGSNALQNNSSAYGNIGIGSDALQLNNGSYNTAIGTFSMLANTTGSDNTALGAYALINISGNFNTALGYGALGNTTDAWGNTALGYSAGGNNQNGYYNTFIGAETEATADGIFNSTALGRGTTVTAPSQVRIGNSFVNSIGGFANWTNISDGRVKKNIKQNVPGLTFINKLRPVTYNLDLDAADKILQPPVRKDKDGKTVAPSQFDISVRNAKQQVVYTGFIAQDVEKAAKELNFDFSGVDAAKNDKDLYGLRYSEFVVPLVRAVQELSRQNDDLKKENEVQKKISTDLQNRIEKLEAIVLLNNQQTKTNPSVQASSSAPGSQDGVLLSQNIPNPFSHTTTISYILPQQYSSAKIIITDKSGTRLKEVSVSGTGKNSLQINTSNLSSATYQYSLYIDGKLIGTKQMVIAK